MDLFDVTLNSSDVGTIEWSSRFRTTSGSLLPLACTNFQVAPGRRMAVVTPEGTRVILVTTDFGNVVLHETDRASSSVVAVAPTDLMGIVGKGRLSDEQVSMILGLWGKDNIGEVLFKLIRSVDKAMAVA